MKILSISNCKNNINYNQRSKSIKSQTNVSDVSFKMAKVPPEVYSLNINRQSDVNLLNGIVDNYKEEKESLYLDKLSKMTENEQTRALLHKNKYGQSIMHLLDGEGRKQVINILTSSKREALLNRLLTAGDNFGRIPLCYGEIEDKLPLIDIALSDDKYVNMFSCTDYKGISPLFYISPDEKLEVLNRVKDDKSKLEKIALSKDAANQTSLFYNLPQYNRELVHAVKNDRELLENLLFTESNDIYQNFVFIADNETVKAVFDEIKNTSPEFISQLVSQKPYGSSCHFLYAAADDKLQFIFDYLKDDDETVKELIFSPEIMNSSTFIENTKKNQIYKNQLKKYPEEFKLELINTPFENIKNYKVAEFISQLYSDDEESIKEIFEFIPQFNNILYVDSFKEHPNIQANIILNSDESIWNSHFSKDYANNFLTPLVKELALNNDEVSIDTSIKLLKFYQTYLGVYDTEEENQKISSALNYLELK